MNRTYAKRSALQRQAESELESAAFSWDAIARALSGRGAEHCRLEEVNSRFKIPSAFCEAEKEIPGLFSDTEWNITNGGDNSLVAVPRSLWEEYGNKLKASLIPKGYTERLINCDYLDTSTVVRAGKSLRWIIPSKAWKWFPTSSRIIHLRSESAYIRILTAEAYQADLNEAAKLRAAISSTRDAGNAGPSPFDPTYSTTHPDGPISKRDAVRDTCSKSKRRSVHE